MLYGRPEISRTLLHAAPDGQETAAARLHGCLFPRQGKTDGRTGRRHDYHQGHVGPDPAAPCRHAGQAVQEEHLDSGRFPYPLYPRLRPGFGARGHRGRRRHRRYQLLVFRRRHGCPGHRADPRVLRQTGCRHRREHGGRGQDQHPAARDPQGAQPVGVRCGQTRTQGIQPADRQAARRDRRPVRQGHRGRQGRR